VVPNLDFYAVDDDRRHVLSAVYGLGNFRVFEAYAEPGKPLREFHSVDQVPVVPHGPHLMLHVVDAGVEPIVDRVDPNRASGLLQCEGWGLIQLLFGGFFQQRELRWSHTNHDTIKRAEKLASHYPEFGSPRACDWAAVARASSRLNRAIGTLAVDKIGSHPVLAAAAQLIGSHRLQHEYGTGIHAEPSFGMRHLTATPPAGYSVSSSWPSRSVRRKFSE
jgi:hypothetical protein